MEATTLKFEAWQSAVDPGFWAELARRKLDTIGLSEDPVRVEALYAPRVQREGVLSAQLDRGAFADDDGSDAAVAKARDALAGGRARMPGTLYNVNTLERFREADRADILFTAAYDVWRAITTGEAERDPSLLSGVRASSPSRTSSDGPSPTGSRSPPSSSQNPSASKNHPSRSRRAANRASPSPPRAANGSPPAAFAWLRAPDPPRHPPSRVIPDGVPSPAHDLRR